MDAVRDVVERVDVKGDESYMVVTAFYQYLLLTNY